MRRYSITPGTTNQTIYVMLYNSASDDGLSGLSYNSSGLTCYTTRTGGTASALALANQTVAGAHTDGGFVEVDGTNCPGLYRLDLDDATIGGGADHAIVMLQGAASLRDTAVLIDLSGVDAVAISGDTTAADNLEAACDNYSVERGLTGTALPAAAADAAGGVPISDAGGLDIDAKLANTNEVTAARMAALTDWINGGRLDLILDTIAADTTTDIPALIATAQADLDIITGASGVNLLAATQASIDAIEADTNELQGDWTNAGRLDALLDAIKAVTDALPEAGALTTIGTDTARLTAARAQAIDDWINGGRLDLLLDAIKAVTDALPDAGALNDLAAILTDTGTTIPATIATAQLDLTTLTARLSSARAGYLDELSSANIPADLDAVLADTGELQTNQGNWLTATGFSTHDAAAVLAAIQAAGTHLTLIKAVTDALPDAGALTTIAADAARLTAARAGALTDWIDGGRLDLILDIIAADTTTDIPALIAALNDPSAASIADSVWDEARAGHVAAGSFGEGVKAESLNTQAKADVNAEADTALSDYDAPTRTEATSDKDEILGKLPGALVGGRMASDVEAISGSTTAADNMELGALTIVPGTAQTGTLSTTVMTTDLSEVTDDHYIGRAVIWTSGVLKNQGSCITDYSGTSGTVTYDAVTEAPSNGDTFIIV